MGTILIIVLLILLLGGGGGYYGYSRYGGPGDCQKFCALSRFIND